MSPTKQGAISVSFPPKKNPETSSMAEGGASRVVLIAVDGSEQAWDAFVYYQNILHRPENEVILLHCADLTYKFVTCEADFVKQRDEHRRKYKEIQDKYEKALKDFDIKQGSFVVEDGRPDETIVNYAEEHKVTMIVMGTRGLGLIRRTIMGSVSDYVVHHSHCPVTVYKKPEKKADDKTD